MGSVADKTETFLESQKTVFKGEETVVYLVRAFLHLFYEDIKPLVGYLLKSTDEDEDYNKSF